MTEPMMVAPSRGDAEQQLANYQQRFAQVYPRYLPEDAQHIGDVYRAIHYSFAAGGKRLRPALIYALADSLSIDLSCVDSAAVAVECIHTYSLIHDDLPEMDDDDLRRGQPSCHKQFNTATAILAGDALNTLAFDILARDDALPANKRLQQIALLSAGAGIAGMVGGQDTDLTCEKRGGAVDLVTLSDLHRRKTAKLIEACLLMAYVASDVVETEKYQQLSDAGIALGLFYQIQDDILDVTQSSDVLGKPAASDIVNDKATYVSLLGLAGARQSANATADDINTALTAFFSPNEMFQDTPLAAIIEKIITRRY